MDDQEAYVAPTRGSRIEVVCVMERYRSEFVQVVFNANVRSGTLLKMGGVWK